MHPSWPRSKLKLSPILAKPYEHASVATPGRYLAVFCNGSSFTPGPSTIWELLTNVEVNIITMLHDTRHTCIYITLVTSTTIHFLLSIHFPFPWAGWLSSTCSVQYIYYLRNGIHVHNQTQDQMGIILIKLFVW
jgi:hypothetical protein